MAAVALYLLVLLRERSNLNTSKALQGKILEIVLLLRRVVAPQRRTRFNCTIATAPSEAPDGFVVYSYVCVGEAEG
jgi:hypothetical protein